MSGFRDVKVDANANTLTVGGAVRFGDVLDLLYAAGKEIRMCLMSRLDVYRTNRSKLPARALA